MRSGVSDEIVSFFEARGLARVGAGGGDDTEDITVHEALFANLQTFLAASEPAWMHRSEITLGWVLAGVTLSG